MPPTTPAGTDSVSGLALDGVIAEIVAKINELVIAIGQAHDEQDMLADGAVRWRAFSVRAKTILGDMIAHLGELYLAYTTRWTVLPVPDGGPYAASSGGFFSGYSADPSSNTWVFTMPGEAPARFRVRILVRHFAAADPTATAKITLSGSRSQTWVLNPAPGAAVVRTLEFNVVAGDVLMIYFVPGDEFTGDTDFPNFDIERFPYRPRYRACGAFQFDWLSYIPLEAMVLATSSRAAITTESNHDIEVEDEP